MLEDRYVDLINKITNENNKALNSMKIVCIGCLIATVLTMATVVGGILYFFSSYAVEIEDTITYEQQSDGNSSIINGNQFNDSSTNNEK